MELTYEDLKLVVQRALYRVPDHRLELTYEDLKQKRGA